MKKSHAALAILASLSWVSMTPVVHAGTSDFNPGWSNITPQMTGATSLGSRSMLYLANGSLVIGDLNGAWVRQNGQWTHAKVPSDAILPFTNSYAAGSGNTVYAGGSENYQTPAVWKMENGQWSLVSEIQTGRPYDSADHVAYLAPSLLAVVDSDNGLYIGSTNTAAAAATSGAGSATGSSNAWTHIPAPQAMQNSKTNAMVGWNNQIVIATSVGLLCYQLVPGASAGGGAAAGSSASGGSGASANASSGTWIILGGTAAYPFLNQDVTSLGVSQDQSTLLVGTRNSGVWALTAAAEQAQQAGQTQQAGQAGSTSSATSGPSSQSAVQTWMQVGTSSSPLIGHNVSSVVESSTGRIIATTLDAGAWSYDGTTWTKVGGNNTMYVGFTSDGKPTVIEGDDVNPQDNTQDNTVYVQDGAGYARTGTQDIQSGNYNAAVTPLQAGTQLGNPDAEYGLAYLYEKGYGVAKDASAALSLYQKASAQGSANADNALGVMYEEGAGVTRDYGTAATYFRQAISAGDVTAATNLGFMYAQGLGVTKSDKSAALWYGKAAAAGDAEAQTALGWLYEKGSGVTKSASMAVHEFELAANQHNADAEASLATVYLTGEGVQASPLTALSWIHKAAADNATYAGTEHTMLSGVISMARRGNPSAEEAYGQMLLTGGIVAQNPAGANTWFRKAATAKRAALWDTKAVGQAAYYLGYQYMYGNGVKTNYHQALYWFTKAGHYGYAVSALIQQVKELINPALKPGTPQNIKARINQILSMRGSGFVPSAPQQLSTNDMIVLSTIHSVINEQPGLMSLLQNVYRNSRLMGGGLVDTAIFEQRLGISTEEQILVENFDAPSNGHVVSFDQATLRTLSEESNALSALQKDYRQGNYAAVQQTTAYIDNLAMAETALGADIIEYFPG